MRPIKLSITGFGPFSSRQDVDFTRFDEIFLITGKTGAGKSTVFDAMMYALYGELPGTRDIRSALSDYTTGDNEPVIDFTFTLQGTQYRVQRTLPYTRESKRGAGRMVEVPSTVSLHKISGKGWTQQNGTATEINSIIENLLHLTAEEFSKIVLLPQGEFQRFLVSDTRDKKVLLEKLFPTERHHLVTELLKERTRDLKKELNSKNEERTRLLKIFDPDTCEKDHASLEKSMKDTQTSLTKSKKMLNDTTEELARALETEKDFIERDKTLDEYNKQLKQDEEMALLQKKTATARELLSIAPLMSNHKELTTELNTLEDTISLLTKELEKEQGSLNRALTRAEEIPLLEKSIAQKTEELGKLNSLLPKVEKLMLVEKNRGHMQTALTRLQDDHKQLIKKHKELISKRDATRKKTADWEKELLSYEDILRGLSETESVYHKVLEIEDKKSKQQSLEEAIDSQEKKLQEQTAQLALLHSEAAALLSKKHMSLASELAAELKENEPCPVCGSLSHPSPCASGLASFNEEDQLRNISDQIISIDKSSTALTERLNISRQQNEEAAAEIKELIKKTPEQQNEVQKRLDSLKKEKERLEMIRKELLQQRELLKEHENILEQTYLQAQNADSGIKEHLIKIENIDLEIRSLKEECGDPQELNSKITTIKQDLDRSKTKIQSIEKEIKRSEMTIEGYKKEKALHSESRDSLMKKTESLMKTIQEELSARNINSLQEASSLSLDKKTIDSNEKRIAEFKEQMKSYEATLKYIAGKINNKTRPDLNTLEAKKKDISKNINELEEKLKSLFLQIRDLEKNAEDLALIGKEIERLTSDSRSLVELSNDLSGENPRNLTFQNFILGAYLEEVALYASDRLNSMSEGRYNLIVNEEISHGNRKAGLDLDVFDAHTGQKRSVKSLSGGEKFLASIALALGLADVIQSRSGGIELDAIFIDEGFGSLDDTALDRALSVLDTIRGNRLVGIISHVTELKTRIPSQMNIIKDNNGSHISY